MMVDLAATVEVEVMVEAMELISVLLVTVMVEVMVMEVMVVREMILKLVTRGGEIVIEGGDGGDGGGAADPPG